MSDWTDRKLNPLDTRFIVIDNLELLNMLGLKISSKSVMNWALSSPKFCFDLFHILIDFLGCWAKTLDWWSIRHQSGIMIQFDCQVECNPVTAHTKIHHTDLSGPISSFMLSDWMYLVYTWYKPWIFQYILCIYSVYMLSIYYVYTLYIPCIYLVRVLYIIAIKYVITLYIPCGI